MTLSQECGDASSGPGGGAGVIASVACSIGVPVVVTGTPLSCAGTQQDHAHANASTHGPRLPAKRFLDTIAGATASSRPCMVEPVAPAQGLVSIASMDARPGPR
uniref:hypothetical protein n=1 Tax=Dyella soli TaxID=522319 RepID=UPI0013F41C01|nr:hypothetical protein [Dyella soli]